MNALSTELPTRLSFVAAVADLHEATLQFEDNAPGLRVVLRLPAT